MLSLPRWSTSSRSPWVRVQPDRRLAPAGTTRSNSSDTLFVDRSQNRTDEAGLARLFFKGIHDQPRNRSRRRNHSRCLRNCASDSMHRQILMRDLNNYTRPHFRRITRDVDRLWAKLVESKSIISIFYIDYLNFYASCNRTLI